MNNQENIDALINKYLSGNALPEDAMQLEDWKNEDPDNLKYFLDSEKTFNLINAKINIEPNNPQLAWAKILPSLQQTKPVRFTRNFYLKFAASFVLLFALGLSINYFLRKSKPASLVYTTQENSKSMSTSDGSQITLYKNTSLSVDPSFGKSNRTVHLNGSADFHITHKDKFPFIVDAGSFFIKDIGTKFRVILSPNSDTITIKVTEGIVLLYDELGSNLEIKAGQNARYIRSQKQLSLITSVIAKKYSFTFANEKLGEVIDKLSKVYNVQIQLQNPNLKHCIITTTFVDEKIENILGIVTETLGLSLEKTPTGYLIKGQACQP